MIDKGEVFLKVAEVVFNRVKVELRLPIIHQPCTQHRRRANDFRSKTAELLHRQGLIPIMKSLVIFALVLSSLSARLISSTPSCQPSCTS